MQVDRAFLEQIGAYPLSLYVCDSARYEESGPGEWAFVEVQPPDLLHHLGVRSGDGIATVQAIEPITHEPVTPAHRLDSIDAMIEAHSVLEHAEGVLLSVDREDAPGGTFEIWITIER